MKIYFFAAAILCSLVLVKCDEMEDFEKYNNECQTERSEAVVAGLAKPAASYDDPEWWCPGACMARKFGTIVNSQVIAERMVANILKKKEGGAKDVIKADAEGCIDKANIEKDECAVFMTLQNCLSEKHLL